MTWSVFSVVQTKYKEAGKKETSSCLYSLLPATLETQHAKETTELLSDVRTASLLSQTSRSGRLSLNVRLSGEVQGEWEEGPVQLSLLHPA